MASVQGDASRIHKLLSSSLSQLCHSSIAFIDSIHITGELKFNLDSQKSYDIVIDENVQAVNNWEIFKKFPITYLADDLDRELDASVDKKGNVVSDRSLAEKVLCEPPSEKESNGVDAGLECLQNDSDVEDEDIHIDANSDADIIATKPKNKRDRHRRKIFDKPFGCKVCKKNFLTKSYLEKHIRSHNIADNVSEYIIYHKGEIPFQCAICGKGFESNEKRKKHLKDHLDPNNASRRRKDVEKPFGCKLCGKSFVEKTYLKNHIAKHEGDVNVDDNIIFHKGLTPYTCKICGARFSSNCSMRLHVHTHSDKRPHLCTKCSKQCVVKVV